MEAAAPFCARQSLSTNADLAEAEEQQAAARSRYGAWREESGGFHRPPAAEKRDSRARALGEGGEGGEGGREQGASQRLRYPSAELPELRRGGGGGQGQGRQSWRCPRWGVAPGDPGAAESRGLQEWLATPGQSPALPARGAMRTAPALPGRTGPFLSDSGEPVMNDRTIELLV